jgi:hypothetical protein
MALAKHPAPASNHRCATAEAVRPTVRQDDHHVQLGHSGRTFGEPHRFVTETCRRQIASATFLPVIEP